MYRKISVIVPHDCGLLLGVGGNASAAMHHRDFSGRSQMLKRMLQPCIASLGAAERGACCRACYRVCCRVYCRERALQYVCNDETRVA